MNTSPTFIFFGTPDVSAKTLEHLRIHGLLPLLIVTAPDRPVGRHFTMTPPPTKVWAEEHAIPYLQPEKLTLDFIETLPPADLFIVVAYGKILPQSLIDRANIATLNIHYSLLPKYRGASPVEAAILAGDHETGVSIQKMVFKLDAGPVIASATLPITHDDTTQTLRDKLIPLGAELLERIIIQGTFDGAPQDETAATHCGKIKKEDAQVSLSESPESLWNKYRAYHGWPTIYFMDENNKRVKITAARFENNSFIIERVIPEGKKEIDWTDYQKNHS